MMNRVHITEDLKVLLTLLPKKSKRNLLLNQIGVGVSSFLSLVSVALVPLFFALIFPELGGSNNRYIIFLQAEVQNLQLTIPQIGFGVMALILLSNGILAYFSFLNFKIANGIFREVSTELFRYFLYKDMAYHLRINSAYIKSKVQSDCSRIVNHVLIPSLNIIPGALTLGMVVTGLAILNWKFTVIIFAFCFAIFLSFSELFKSKIRGYGALQTKLSVNYHSTLSEGLNSLKETKILGKEDVVIDEFFRITHLLTSTDAKSNFLQLAPKFIGESALFVLIILLGCATVSFDQSLFSISELAMFGVGSLKALPSINMIFSNLARINSGLSAIDHIKADLISAQTEAPFRFSGIPEGDITLNNVSFNYPGTHETIFEGLDLTIHSGSKIAIIGPSGSGKSTLIDLILGLLQPTIGKVVYNLQNSNQFRVSYVPQKIFLTDKSIEENIYFGRIELMNDQAFLKTLSDSHSMEFVSKMEGQEKAFVGEDGCRLSGGERQRIGMARALINRPNLLIVDEGTSAMDPNLEALILNNLLSSKENLTLIWVTHRYQNLNRFDSVFKVENRKLIPQNLN